MTEQRHNVLCGCGWGQMNVPESEIPHNCPVCNFDFFDFALMAECFEEDDDCDDDDNDNFLGGF